MTSKAKTIAELRQAVKDRDPERVATVLCHIGRLDGSFARVADTLLEWAVSEDLIYLVRAALEQGAPPNRREGQAPLLAAATSVAMAQLLIEHGADVHATWKPTRNEGGAANVLHYLKSSREHADVKRYFTERLGLINQGELAAVPPMPEQEFWPLVETALRAGKTTRRCRRAKSSSPSAGGPSRTWSHSSVASTSAPRSF